MASKPWGSEHAPVRVVKKPWFSVPSKPWDTVPIRVVKPTRKPWER